MSYKLFLDDKFTPDMAGYYNQEFVVLRSYQECVNHIKTNGLPDFMSFDYDLGTDKEGNSLPTGEDVVKWLVIESKLDLTHFKYSVHTLKKEKKERLEKLLHDYIDYLQYVDQCYLFSQTFFPYHHLKLKGKSGGWGFLYNMEKNSEPKPKPDLSGDIFNEDF